MGRPRQSRNVAPPKLRIARFERMKTGLSLRAISARTGIPESMLSDFERGVLKSLNDTDLAALARVYGYEDSQALLAEAVVVPAEHA